MDDLDPYSGDIGPDDDGDYYDFPDIDPGIRTNYEAALGRLILAHNDVDYHLTQLIECCLKKLGKRSELSQLAKGMFADRLKTLKMLNAISPDLRLNFLDYDELSSLNGERNIVAHGHFEQNPYDGDYRLIRNSETFKAYSVERLDKITARLKTQAHKLSPIVAFYNVETVFPEGHHAGEPR